MIMESQRIILVNVPRFLDEALQRAFAPVPDLQIVDKVSDWTKLPQVLQRTPADWIIAELPTNPETKQAVEALLATHPALRLLNVASDGSHITLQWVEPRAQTIDDFSLDELVSLLTKQPPPSHGPRRDHTLL